jgi:hypothetical protein
MEKKRGHKHGLLVALQPACPAANVCETAKAVGQQKGHELRDSFASSWPEDAVRLCALPARRRAPRSCMERHSRQGARMNAREHAPGRMRYAPQPFGKWQAESTRTCRVSMQLIRLASFPRRDVLRRAPCVRNVKTSWVDLHHNYRPEIDACQIAFPGSCRGCEYVPPGYRFGPTGDRKPGLLCSLVTMSLDNLWLLVYHSSAVEKLLHDQLAEKRSRLESEVKWKFY